jgi:hypothetical protein
MSDTTPIPIGQMTRTDLEQLIATVVRRVVREELQNASYIRSDGIQVRVVAEEASPDYLAELQADYGPFKTAKSNRRTKKSCSVNCTSWALTHNVPHRVHA